MRDDEQENLCGVCGAQLVLDGYSHVCPNPDCMLRATKPDEVGVIDKETFIDERLNRHFKLIEANTKLISTNTQLIAMNAKHLRYSAMYTTISCLAILLLLLAVVLL